MDAVNGKFPTTPTAEESDHPTEPGSRQAQLDCAWN